MQIEWFSVKKNKPPQKQLLMVSGNSGYISNTKFLTLAYLDQNYRPMLPDGQLRWISVQNDELSDQGWYPTFWAYPITLPEEILISVKGEIPK